MSTPSPPPDGEGIEPSTDTTSPSLPSQKKYGSPEVIDLTNELDDVDIEEILPTQQIEPKIKQEPTEKHLDRSLEKVEGTTEPTAIDMMISNNEQNLPTTSTDDIQHPIADSVENNDANSPAIGQSENPSNDDMARMLQEYLWNQQNQPHTDSRQVEDEAAINLDSEEDEAEQAASFAALERKYQAKEAAGLLDLVDEVEFTQAKEAEARRQKILQRKRAYQEEENSMFFPEAEEGDLIELPSAPSFADAATHPKKKPRTTNFGTSGQTFRRHTVVESDSENEPPARQRSARRGRGGKGGTRATDPKSRVSKPRERKGGQNGSQKGGRRAGRGRQPEGMLNLPSLWHNDIVANAQRNQGRGPQPGFSTKNKAVALKDLLSSIPRDHRKPFAATTKELNLACKQFSHRGNGSMHADGAGRWRLKGMTSSLYHYQLLGAGWMRERETGSSAPYGGLLADSMGYGKTMMTICNILEGRPKAKAKNKTTLIVCPSSLCQQWLEEITTHVQPDLLGEIMVYKSGSRVQSADVTKTLTNCGIVITTYHEVMKNYPKCEPPRHLALEESKQTWWSEYYEKNKGPLLRIAFHRVVLDEGHLIKNHEGRTSKACRVLCAKYRWILSGTPLQNRLEELGAFLMFLGVDGAATYDQFKDNFCKRNLKCLQRVDALLRKIMIRRTGSDEMFGRPILSLPALQYDTIIIDFNTTEKAIYQIVRARFLEKIHQWSAGGILQKNTRNIWTMLLRLRQMCAHVLIVGPILKDLLEYEDLEKLWRLTDGETLPADENANPGTVTVLRKMLGKTRTTPDPEKSHSQDSTTLPPGRDQDVAQANTTPDVVEEPNIFTGPAAPGGAKFKFRKYLRKLHEDGDWGEINKRSLCHRCREPPQEPRVTKPCLHIYCQECLGAMFVEAAAQDLERPVCFECSVSIEASEKLRGEAELLLDLDDPASQQSNSNNNRNKRKGSTDSDGCDLGWIDAPGAPLLSSKAQAVTSTIMGWLSKDPEAKIIIFSLFLPMIRVFQKICLRQGWGYCLYIGAMDQRQRQKSISEFKDQPKKNILLASMKAGGLGLNLTMASKCCVVDPWWNESVEDQAWSRIFRIGQDKDVEVKRFMVKDSIDTQLMLKMQERKTAEISRVIGDGRPDKNMTVQDLIALFGPVQYDPETGRPQVGEHEDVVDQFVFAEDQFIQDDSDAEVPNTPAARPW